MGCLALLILAFLFRGVIFAVLSALLSLTIKVGVVGFIFFVMILIIAAMVD
ncbi:MAG: hypothetical protein OXG39_02300 [Chloroflexi bacterium]|nr:hypothetical protein [Chloroflexota bacterium]